MCSVLQMCVHMCTLIVVFNSLRPHVLYSVSGSSVRGISQARGLPSPSSSKHRQELSQILCNLDCVIWRAIPPAFCVSFLDACVSCLCVHAKSPSVVSDSLQPYGMQPARLLCPWDPPGKNTRVGCHAFLQGIFPTQGPNPHLLHLLHW